MSTAQGEVMAQMPLHVLEQAGWQCLVEDMQWVTNALDEVPHEVKVRNKGTSCLKMAEGMQVLGQQVDFLMASMKGR